MDDFSLPKSAPTQMYVQFGCGPYLEQAALDGWLNYDCSPSLWLQRLPVVGKLAKKRTVLFPVRVRFGDIRKGLPLPKGSVKGLYSSHVMEHMSLEDCRKSLRQCHQLLSPDGIFRVVVPDLLWAAKRYISGVQKCDSQAAFDFVRQLHIGMETRPHGLDELARFAFGNSRHLWMWDEHSLTAELHTAGFSSVNRCFFNDCADPKFKEVEDLARFEQAVALEARP